MGSYNSYIKDIRARQFSSLEYIAGLRVNVALHKRPGVPYGTRAYHESQLKAALKILVPTIKRKTPAPGGIA